MKNKRDLRLSLEKLQKNQLIDIILENEHCNLNNDKDAVTQIRSLKFSYKIEHFFVVLLDTQNNVLKKSKIFTGNSEKCPIEIAKLIRYCLSDISCCRVILLHNHPGGTLKPSTRDIALKKDIEEVLNIIGIKVLANIIFTRNGHVTY